MKFLGKKSSISLAGMIIAMVAGYVLLVFMPLRSQIAAAKSRLDEKRMFVAKEASLQAELAKSQTEQQAIGEHTQSWPEIDNPNVHLSQILGDVSRHAKQLGLDALRLEPAQSTKLNLVHRIPVQLGCRGSFMEIHDLIRRIEEMPYEIWIHRIELAPHRDDSGELTCEMEFEAFAASTADSG